jgi:hypothetical protein
LCNILALSTGGVLDHDGNAAFADEIAELIEGWEDV